MDRRGATRGPIVLTWRVDVASTERRSYLAVALLVPLLGASLGVNGGAIFQIIAIENLGLDARQIGLAVGLGAVSIPFQIWAARIPLRLAHRNLRLFVLVMAGLCWLMAWLVLGPISSGFVIASAIIIAIMAELAVSVLFATSWQPLLSINVSHEFRQRLNAQARAVGSVLLIGIVTVVGWLSATGRIATLLVIGAIGLALLPAVNQIRSPSEAEPASSSAREDDESGAGPSGEVGSVTHILEAPHAVPAPDMLPLYVAIGFAAVPAWPFFLTYAADAFWPTANLGLIGAALTVGSLAVAAGWRPTEHRLLFRARFGTVLLLLCALGLVPISRPVSGAVTGVLVLAIIAIAAGAATAVRMSLLELVHRRSTVATSVRILTILDVVGSTAMQVSFLAAGYLISASVDSTWIIDPYQLSLMAGPGLLLVALNRLPVQQPQSVG